MRIASRALLAAALVSLYCSPAVADERHELRIIVLGEPFADSLGSDISITGLLVSQ
ncbi:MAG: hypothetical protein OEM63_06880 [Gammaproteobacteria bacterium]|nr:hypothetical protein [Gammaproteobacteria bacterium]